MNWWSVRLCGNHRLPMESRGLSISLADALLFVAYFPSHCWLSVLVFLQEFSYPLCGSWALPCSWGTILEELIENPMEWSFSPRSSSWNSHRKWQSYCPEAHTHSDCNVCWEKPGIWMKDGHKPIMQAASIQLPGTSRKFPTSQIVYFAHTTPLHRLMHIEIQHAQWLYLANLPTLHYRRCLPNFDEIDSWCQPWWNLVLGCLTPSWISSG